MDKSRPDLTTPREEHFKAIWAEALTAGLAAGEAAKPTPMLVISGGQIDCLDEGVCGFAWVRIMPATTEFARWGKRQGLFSKAYPTGVQYWVSEFDQSMERKSACAQAIARILREHGITCFSCERMD